MPPPLSDALEQSPLVELLTRDCIFNGTFPLTHFGVFKALISSLSPVKFTCTLPERLGDLLSIHTWGRFSEHFGQNSFYPGPNRTGERFADGF